MPNATDWDLLLILLGTTPLPPPLLSSHVRAQFSLTVGIPSSTLESHLNRNEDLLHPKPGSVPELRGALIKPRIGQTSQDLALTSELLGWAQQYIKQRACGGPGAVSMLNLLSFRPSPEAHAHYAEYGRAFAESVGSRRGGNAKVVGKVVPVSSSPPSSAQEEEGGRWEEVALAHYPSILHFADMLASGDYQEVNHRSRLGALRDTCILMTSELDEQVLEGVRRGMAARVARL